jgi:hypothetical protein
MAMRSPLSERTRRAGLRVAAWLVLRCETGWIVAADRQGARHNARRRSHFAGIRAARFAPPQIVHLAGIRTPNIP